MPVVIISWEGLYGIDVQHSAAVYGGVRGIYGEPLSRKPKPVWGTDPATI